MKNIGAIIGKVVTEKGIAKKDLATKMGMHPGSISRVLNADGMQVEMVRKFCEALDYDFFANFSGDLKITKKEIDQTEIEKELAKSKEEIERLKQEIGYLKQINELLSKKS